MSTGKRVILVELAEVRAKLTAVWQELTSKSEEFVELKRRQSELVEAARVLRQHSHTVGRTRVTV